ncbi:MAG: hypothetical protein WD472_06830 [Dehalococcoidia bacterium]
MDDSLLVVASFVAGGFQLAIFSLFRQPGSHLARLVIAIASILLVLVLSSWWAFLLLAILSVMVLAFEMVVDERERGATLLLLGLGFSLALPVVYIVLFTAQQSVGRDVIPPVLFSGSVLFLLVFLRVESASAATALKIIGRGLMGFSACFATFGVLSVIFWDTFAT